MIVEHSQRHTERRIRWVAHRGVVSTRHLEVVIGSPSVAKAFVEQHHYSGTSSPTAHPALLYYRGELVGAALFGPLASMNAHRFVFPTLTPTEGVTLGRFVIVDGVGYNAESFFIARCFELLAGRGVIGIDSCADPRWGHIGTIYKATNGRHVGRTKPSTIHVFDDGTELSNRTEGKARRGEIGRRYAIEQLVARGARPPEPGEDMRAWVARWRRELTRSMRHPGKFRYLWCLDRRRRRDVLRAPALPYPKLEARAA